MHTPTSVPAIPSFMGEVYFAKSDDYIRSLATLQVGQPELSSIALPDSMGSAQFFEAAAAAIRQAEELSVASLLAMPLLALCDEGPEGHPLNWLNITESKKTEERRQCHEWYLTLEDDGTVQVTFEHGKFGYRHESFDRWSAAFARMAELLAGTCIWQEFGDRNSRRTMLGKGQFYWQDPKTGEPVPVDNFVYVTPSGNEVTLAGVSHRCALHFELNAETGSSEWFDDYAEGLLRLADIMDGTVVYLDFGRKSNPATYAKADGKNDAAKRLWAPAGQFIVKSILLYGDTHLAPVLTYITGETAQAQLITEGDGWVVRVRDAQRPWREQKFEACNASDAVRTLAEVLNGIQDWSEFDVPG